MSFGWSAGDIATAVRVVWNVYQCFTDGPLNASREFSEFMQSLSLISNSLKKLNQIFSLLPEDQGSELAGHFHETEAECRKFVENHQEILSKEAQKSLNFTKQCKWAFQTITWPAERDTAQRLWRNLDTHVQIASLQAAQLGLQADRAIYHNTNELLRDGEKARAERLEILKAVKQVGDRVELMLKRCAPGTTAENEVDHQFLEQFSQRALPQLFSPGIHGSRSTSRNMPDQGSPSLLEPAPFQSGPSADQIVDTLQHFSQTMEFLVLRLNTSTGPGPIEQRITGEVGHTEDLKPVMSLVHSIRGTVDAALDYAGFHDVSLPRDGRTETRGEGSFRKTRSERPEQTISRALLDWDNLNERTNYHLRHLPPEEPRTRRQVIKVPPIRRQSTDQSTDLQTLFEMQGTVTITFPDPSSKTHATLHDAIEGCFEVCCYSSNHETKCVILKNKDRSVETSRTSHHPSHDLQIESTFIPWLSNSHVRGSQPGVLRAQFKGSHKVKICEGDIVKQYSISPVYTFSTNEDFMAFQTNLLRKRVLYSTDVKHIASSDGTDQQCSLENLRILGDETGPRSILYFAEKRPSRHGAGFQEWQLDNFEAAQQGKGSDGFRLILTSKRRPSRRSTSSSQESNITHVSVDSNMTSTEIAPSNVLQKIKGLKIIFHNEQDRDTCKKCLDQLIVWTNPQWSS